MKEGARQIAELLLAHGADADAVKPDGGTALHAAASRGHTEIAALLIAHGASVNARTRDGLSPLDFARTAGHQDLVPLLQSTGIEKFPMMYTGRCGTAGRYRI